ncbi:hypothetical protein [Blastococcus aurantiacus]|uniref:hypothetical protein n=1 Tax=Blastococcus aurantiacus TaxID=1550231 RepID=UPI000B859423|nr:hypothetical protein [Blastococcus aurantiacus]
MFPDAGGRGARGAGGGRGGGAGAGRAARRLLQADDVAAAVRWMVATPPHVCPVEIDLQPQRTP